MNMTPEERTARLRNLMAEYGVKVDEVGEIIGVTAQTVRVYRSKAPQSMKEKDLRLLELELEKRAAAAKQKKPTKAKK